MPCFDKSFLEYTHDTNCSLTHPAFRSPLGMARTKDVYLPIASARTSDKQDEVVPGDLITTNGRIPEYRSSTVSLLTGVIFSVAVGNENPEVRRADEPRRISRLRPKPKEFLSIGRVELPTSRQPEERGSNLVTTGSQRRSSDPPSSTCLCSSFVCLLLSGQIHHLPPIETFDGPDGRNFPGSA